MSESEAAVIRIGGQGMEKGRHTGFNFFAWLKPIAALEHVRRAAFFIWPLAFAGEQDRGGSAFGPLFPKRGDFLIGIFEFWNGGSPISEYRGDLRGSALFAWDAED